MNHLDPHIIEDILRKESEKDDRPHLQIPLYSEEDYLRWLEQQEEGKDERGITTFDM